MDRRAFVGSVGGGRARVADCCSFVCSLFVHPLIHLFIESGRAELSWIVEVKKGKFERRKSVCV